MKRSSDASGRARHEDVLRHSARGSSPRHWPHTPPHTSRRHLEHPEPDDLLDGSGVRVNRLDGPRHRWAGARDDVDDIEDVGVSRLALARQRHARQRVRATTLLFLLPTTVFSLMLMAMAHVVFRDWRSYESERSIAQAQLLALQEQLDVGQRRLHSLRSPKGREQILAEHGYIRPGDRMLLFPQQPGEAAASGSNDIASSIAARRATIRDGASSSAWDRAARAMTSWLGQISSRPKPAPSTSAASNSASHAASNAASNAVAAPPSTSVVETDGEEVDEAISPADRIVRPSTDAAR